MRKKANAPGPGGPARPVTGRVIGLSLTYVPPKAGNRLPPRYVQTGVLCMHTLRA